MVSSSRGSRSHQPSDTSILPVSAVIVRFKAFKAEQPVDHIHVYQSAREELTGVLIRCLKLQCKGQK